MVATKQAAAKLPKMFEPKIIGFDDLHKIMVELNGYVERGGPSGHDGNITKIWADLQPSFQGASWCAADVCYIWKHAGDPFPAIDHPWGYSFCPDAVNWFKAHKLWSASGHYEPGDTIFYDWVGNGVAEHTGIVVVDHGSAGIRTFEGNTSPTAGGSQSNGGGAYFKTRFHGATVLGVGKSSRWLKDNPKHQAKPVAPKQPVHNPFSLHPHDLPLRKGSKHIEDVKWAQWALSVTVDGDFGKQTANAVELFKRTHGLHSSDGVIRNQCAAALRQVTHSHN